MSDESTEMPTTSETSSGLSRRRFLGVAAGIGAAAATPSLAKRAMSRLEATAAGEGRSASYVRAASQQTPDRGDLIVVSVQLEGGNDTLNTLVPLTSGRYRDLRGSDAIAEENTVRLDDDYGLFAMPHLASQWTRGNLGLVHGVGYQNSSLSHFEDTDIWEKGSTDVATPTGWLGRALDAVTSGKGDPLMAMSIGNLSPSMRAPGWNPVTLPEYGTVPWTAEDRDAWSDAANAFDIMVQPDRTDSPLAAAARTGQSLVFDLADLVGPALQNRAEQEPFVSAFAAENDQFFPGDQAVEPGELGEQLSVIADLVNAGLPTRAYHVYQGGYDTHADQAGTHPQLIRTLDLAIEQFQRRLGQNADRVVLVTWTEFGRRPEWNGSGTDHGTAGLQFVVGPRAVGGHHGEAPSLDSLDEDDNFHVTTDFRDYLGGIVEGGLGVAASDVFDSSVSPMEVIA